MVFTKVEVWRGIVISLEELENFMYCGNHEDRDSDELRKKYLNSKDQLIDYYILNIEDFVRSEFGGGLIHLKHYGDHGCRGVVANSEGYTGYIVMAIKINTFKRSEFQPDSVLEENLDFIKESGQVSFACGKRMEYPGSVDYCGKGRWVCKQCIQETVNGRYPIDEILDGMVECPNYCFRCNNDKCSGNHENQPLTIQQFIDDLLVDAMVNSYSSITEEVAKSRIKNYYLLDDCLSCT